MSAIEQIERLIEQLPSEDFAKLTAWIDQRRLLWKLDPLVQQREANPICSRSSQHPNADAPMILRDHAAFLNSYSPEDEGLYDDAASR